MFCDQLPFYLYLNYVCNQRCIFCASPQTNQWAATPEIPWPLLRSRLAAEPIENAPVILSGGDPTCYSELFRLMVFLSEKTNSIEVMTNGLLLANDAFAEKFFSYRVASVSIPVYGFEETHNRVVGRAAFQTLLRALDRISTSGVLMNLKLLITAQNLRELPDLLRFLVDRYGSGVHYTLNTLIYGDRVQSSGSWVPIVNARPVVSEILTFGFQQNLNLSLSFVPACALTSEVLAARLLEFYSLSRAKHTQRPGQVLRIITPSTLEFKTEGEEAYEPNCCALCDMNEICLKVHSASQECDESELGLHPILWSDVVAASTRQPPIPTGAA